MIAVVVALLAALRSTVLSRAELAAEILGLRHQDALLRRRAAAPPFAQTGHGSNPMFTPPVDRAAAHPSGARGALEHQQSSPDRVLSRDRC